MTLENEIVRAFQLGQKPSHSLTREGTTNILAMHRQTRMKLIQKSYSKLSQADWLGLLLDPSAACQTELRLSDPTWNLEHILVKDAGAPSVDQPRTVASCLRGLI